MKKGFAGAPDDANFKEKKRMTKISWILLVPIQSLFSPLVIPRVSCVLKKGKDSLSIVYRFLYISRPNIAPTIAIAAMIAIVLYVA